MQTTMSEIEQRGFCRSGRTTSLPLQVQVHITRQSKGQRHWRIVQHEDTTSSWLDFGGGTSNTGLLPGLLIVVHLLADSKTELAHQW